MTSRTALGTHMNNAKVSKLLHPYRYLPFRVKHSIRQLIDLFIYPPALYPYWIRLRERSIGDPKRITQELARFHYKPKISIIMPVYNAPERFLDSAIRSVLAQHYHNWELCVCDDASPNPSVKARLQRWQKKDSRIKVAYSTENEHISGASNRALAIATGEFVGLLDHDDEITPDALYEVVKLLQERPDADMIYSDEDKVDVKERRAEPYFKPDWSPDYILSVMYTCHFGVYRKKLMDELGGFRKGFEGSQDYDLVLRISERTSNIYHIPKILYHWRTAPGSCATAMDAKPYARIAAKKAIAEHLERRHTPGTVLDGDRPGYYKVIFHSPDTSAAPVDAPSVSIIVTNYNHARFLRKRIDSILQQTFQDFELILLDDRSTDDSRSILSSHGGDPRIRIEFNDVNSGSTFKQWNKGIRLARGKYVWIAESDDYADERMLERLVAVLDADAAIAFAYCRSWRVSADDRVEGFADSYLDWVDKERWTADYRADGREECRNFFAMLNTVPNASAVVFRRSIYEGVGGADESLRVCGDWKLWAAMALTGDVAYLSEPLNYFRFHDASVRSKTGQDNVDAAEIISVIRWVLDHVTPPVNVLKAMYDKQSDAWVPIILSTHVPLDFKRTILRSVREIDPHPIRSAVRPALKTVQRKFLRHWNSIRSWV